MGDKQIEPLKKNEIKYLIEHSGSRRRAFAALLRGLRATRSYYDAFRKETVTELDYKTQVHSAELLFAYDIGKPVERREIIERKYDTLESLKERMLKSPALMGALKRLVEELENVREPVEIPLSPP
jgi:hypothetical protein